MKPFLVFLAATAALGLAYALEPLVRRITRVVHRGKYVFGEVLSIDKVAYGRDRYYGVRLLLNTTNGELPVYLGPSWYVNSHAIRLARHDVIEVTGSRVTYRGKPAMIAASVTKGHESLRLRASDGSPLWHES